jgi:WD40 repeat protein
LADTGGRLALANTAQAICIYDIGAEPSTATPHASLPTSGWRLDRLRFSPDGRLIAAALDRAYAVEIWDIEGSRKIVRLDGHRATIDAMSFFPDQCRIATASADATVRIWEVSTGRLLHTFGGQRTAFRCLAISPDGMRIAGSGGDGITRIWDPDVGREVIALRSQGEAVYGLAFDHDGSTLISCSRERVRFWPSPSFEELDAASRSRGSEGP